jgi:hypothetical protein
LKQIRTVILQSNDEQLSRALQKGEEMQNATEFNDLDCFSLAAPDMRKKRNALGLSTGDFRRILSDLRHRPPSQRVFLRKLLRRALAGAPKKFPVVNHVVPDPVSPS